MTTTLRCPDCNENVPVADSDAETHVVRLRDGRYWISFTSENGSGSGHWEGTSMSLAMAPWDSIHVCDSATSDDETILMQTEAMMSDALERAEARGDADELINRVLDNVRAKLDSGKHDSP